MDKGLEYMDIADFMAVDSMIYVLSRINCKLIVYTEDGEFVKSYSLNDYYDYFYMDRRDQGVVFLYSNYSNNIELHLAITQKSMLIKWSRVLKRFT
jgi:hypothetical protein